MISGRYIDRIAAVAMVLAVLLTVSVCWLLPRDDTAVSASAQSLSYPDKVFDSSSITSVEITVDEASWRQMLENAVNEEYICCDVTINGTTFRNVGIRPKGNTSLSQVYLDDTTDRYSFKIEFDHYVEGQTCFGLDKLCLNNIQADTTYLKEFMAYDMTTFLGVASPLFAFSDITVNGNAWGFYLAVEAVEDSFAQRNYGGTGGIELYKPEGDIAEGIKGMAGRGSAGAGGADLVYTGDDPDSYSDIFNSSVFGADREDEQRVIEALRVLSESGDPQEIEAYIDVDQVLRYFACNTFLVNLDSYVSSLKHNYYLEEEDGVLSIIPWDFNLAFGGFQSGSASSAVNFPIDTPVASGTELADRPLIGALLAVGEYKEQYHAYLRELVDDYFGSGRFTQRISQMYGLISSYVESDASAFYTYDEYQTGVEALKEFGLLRSESVEGQLNGAIPSTSEGQSADASSLVDASSLNLSDLGQQGGNMAGGNMAGDMGGGDMSGFGGGQMPAMDGPPEWNGDQPADGGSDAFADGRMMPFGRNNQDFDVGSSSDSSSSGASSDFSGQTVPPDGIPNLNGDQGEGGSASPGGTEGQMTPPEVMPGTEGGQGTDGAASSDNENGQPPGFGNGQDGGNMQPPSNFGGGAGGMGMPGSSNTSMNFTLVWIFAGGLVVFAGAAVWVCRLSRKKYMK